MEGKTVEDIIQFQEDCIDEFHKRVDDYCEREAEAQVEFNQHIYGPDEEG